MIRPASIPQGLAVRTISPEAADEPVPRYIDCYIRDAEDRAETYGIAPGAGRFVPGDVRYVFQVLQWMLRSDVLPAGACFLEWGSGQGLAAILASLLGLKAMGVELDPVLVRESRELAARYDAAVRFVRGTYDPDLKNLEVITAEGHDLVYAYPWPDEEARLLQLFAWTADPGAYLLICLGPEDLRLVQKVEGE